MSRIVFAIWVVVVFTTTANGQLRPVVPSPEHLHDRFVTRPKEHVMEFRAYTASFDLDDDDNGDGSPDYLGVPQWVSYQLNRGGPAGDNDRPRRWMAIPGLPNSISSPDDDSYRNSGFSRGHMCRRAHAQRLGTDANYNTFCVVNACPQLQRFNGGHWLGLEDLCSLWANRYHRIWITCGPIFLDQEIQYIGDDNEIPVAIPDQFFKIVTRQESPDDEPLILAFIYDHSGELDDRALNVDHTPFLTSVDHIEGLTGLDFFTALDDEVEERLEANVACELWPSDFDDGIEGFLAAALADSNNAMLRSDSRVESLESVGLREESVGDADSLDSDNDMSSFRVATWNLKWFYDEDPSDDFSEIGRRFAAGSKRKYDRRLRAAANAISQLNPDVMALQEVENAKVVDDIARKLRNEHELEFQVGFVKGRDTYTGQDVAYLVRNGIDFDAYRFSFEQLGNRTRDLKDISKHCVLDIRLAGERIRFVNVHLITRPSDRMRQARTLRRWIADDVQDENVIVLGDFNVGLRYSDTDDNSDIGMIRGLQTASNADDLFDLHKFLPRNHRPTHASGRQLDRVLISSNLNDNEGITFSSFRNEKRLNHRLSDHYPLVAEFSILNRNESSLNAHADRVSNTRGGSATRAAEIERLLEEIESLEKELRRIKSMVHKLVNEKSD